MTVTYRQDVTTSSRVGAGFIKLLFRWHGSIYRLLMHDFIAFVCLYALISIVYRTALNDYHLGVFKLVVDYCNEFNDKIPLGFILGFYCSIVAGRWWAQYQSIPWPDHICMNVTVNLKGQDDGSRMMRRNIARYVNLAINIAFTQMSPPALARLKTLDKFVEEGFLTPKEKKLMENYHEETKNSKTNGPLPDFWIPLVWASSIVTEARAEGKISTDLGCKTILADLTSLRGQCGGMLSFAWINVPLVYTQVVTIAVYSFFLVSLIGRQYIGTTTIDLYVPFLTLLQFLFYMGWLKTAETLLNPFGDDDDDFEILFLINRNHEMGYAIVDMMHSGHPELCQDIYWDSVLPTSDKQVITVTVGEETPGVENDAYIQMQEPANGNLISKPNL